MGKSGNPAKANLKGTISWFSNSPSAPTGYGTQSAQVLNRLKRDGFDVAVLSNYGREGIIGEWESEYGAVREYPRGAEMYSQDITPLNHMHWVASNKKDQPNVLITLYDAWVLKGDKYDEINVASWTPIDHIPAPPAVMKWLKRPSVTPIAMSLYGKQMIENNGVESLYVPHAFEKVFKPTPTYGGATARENMGLGEDRFVVGMNAANKAGGLIHRKAFTENIMAFALFAQKHPDAVLYIHSDAFGSHGGWRLPTLIEACGLKKGQYLFVDPIAYRYGISQEQLANIYSAWDVMLATSYGEGFGVPQIEAQACGVPIITSNFAASVELASPDSFLVEGQPLWDNGQESFFNVPNINGIADALEQAYQRGRGTFPKTLEFAQQYEAETVYKKYWIPTLAKILK